MPQAPAPGSFAPARRSFAPAAGKALRDGEAWTDTLGLLALCQNCARTIRQHRPSSVAIGNPPVGHVRQSQQRVPDRDPWSRGWASIQLPVGVEQRDGGGAGGGDGRVLLMTSPGRASPQTDEIQDYMAGLPIGECHLGTD